MEYSPLHSAAVWLYEVSLLFASIAYEIEQVPIIGEYLAYPFLQVNWFLDLVSYWLDEADIWVRSFNFSLIIEDIGYWVICHVESDPYIRYFFQGHFVAWVIWKLGFPPQEGFFFEIWPEATIRTWIGRWFPFLLPLLEDPTGWLKEQIISRFPLLEYLFEEPAGWVLYMLGVPLLETLIWKDHLFAWLLYRWGMSMYDAFMFEANPIAWVEYQVLKRWPFLDDLLMDFPGWLWEQFRQMIDRYIDLNLDWLVRTVSRVLNSIWEMRV